MLHLDEKRNFQRLQVEAKVRITVEGQTLDGNCLDLSGSGMTVVVSQSFATGDALDVELLPNGNLVPPLKAMAQVIHCDPVENHQYRLGLSLQNVQ